MNKKINSCNFKSQLNLILRELFSEYGCSLENVQNLCENEAVVRLFTVLIENDLPLSYVSDVACGGDFIRLVEMLSSNSVPGYIFDIACFSKGRLIFSNAKGYLNARKMKSTELEGIVGFYASMALKFIDNSVSLKKKLRVTASRNVCKIVCDGELLLVCSNTLLIPVYSEHDDLLSVPFGITKSNSHKLRIETPIGRFDLKEGKNTKIGKTIGFEIGELKNLYSQMGSSNNFSEDLQVKSMERMIGNLENQFI